MNPVDLKQLVISHINSRQQDLWTIVTRLYENPEIAFQEYKSSALIRDFLQNEGFAVIPGVGGLDTSFIAEANVSQTQPTIAFLAEYDALPTIGHACGHNLIAAAAVGAGLGVIAALDQLPGRIVILGTPAEEGGGGKRILVEAGVFEEIDAAMMFHPASKNMVSRGSLASARLGIEFYGQTAHAAASPQEGINALDAMILTFNGINAIRQHLEIKDRIAGIITHGGDAANIIPGYTAAEFSVRGESEKRRAEVMEKALACARAAALATNCELKFEIQPGYSEIIPNPTLASLFKANLEFLGRTVSDPEPNERMGSTDMGNVSKVVPAIHPYLETVPETIAGHTVEFRETCMSESGQAAMLDAAKAMGMTAVDLFLNSQLLLNARQELERYLMQ
jgi:amidohydrolase